MASAWPAMLRACPDSSGMARSLASENQLLKQQPAVMLRRNIAAREALSPLVALGFAGDMFL